jgi:hypothetical protein
MKEPMATSLSCLALTLLLGASQANATQIIRELWDGNPKSALVGKGSNPTSLGLQPATTWSVSPPGNTTLATDNWSVEDWMGINGDAVLPHSAAGVSGMFTYYSGDGNMGNSLTNPATGLPYGHYYSQCYATRPLATNGYIDFNANGTFYMSVRFIKSITDWGWGGDNAGGIGFASSAATNANFVGIGTTRNSFLAEGGVTDISSTCYITTGTLDQPGITEHPDDSGGVYYPRAAGTANLHGQYAGLLIGKLTTSVGGSSTLSVKLLNNFTAPPLDPNAITWDATYNFTETNVMNTLLLWQYGTGPSVQDALRVGTDYGDVIGLELVGGPSAAPGSTIYAGTTVTLSQIARLNTGTYPMSFQWRSNSVDILDATNATLVLTNPTTDYTAAYSVVVSNSFGVLTSSNLNLTVNPAVPPFFTLQPVTPVARYVGGYLAVTVGVDGTPPFGLQLKHAGTNVPGVTAALAGPGTVTLTTGPLTLADFSSSYSVTVTNQFGSSNSQTASLTLITAPAGSFEAAALANGAAAFWKLSDTTNGLTSAGVPLNEYVRGWDGLVPNDPGTYPSYTNVGFARPGAGPVLPGFSGVTAIETPLAQGINAQVNLPSILYSNSMTMVCWTKILGAGNEGLMYDRNKDSGTNWFGIHNFNGNLGSRWGGEDTSWNSGITLPNNRWVMVALVVQPEETTIYAGTDPYTLQSVARSTISGVHTNVSASLPNGRLVIGRSDYGWAVNNNAWAYIRGQFCNAAVFYQALTPSQITNLFVAGFGTGARVIATNGAGNLGLDWYPSLALQEADTVTGPYSDVLDPNTLLPVVPPYTVPINLETNKLFYRVYQVLP